MESIKELKDICQRDMAGADTWQDKLVCRRFSIYFTWLLLHTKVSAMQMTWFFFLLGFVPGVFFVSSRYMAGAFLLQLWYIFDGVDGEIARYKKQTSITGAYFDNLIHYVIHPYIFICIGYGLYKDCGTIHLLFLAVSAAISIMLLSISYDLRNSILYSLEKDRAKSEEMPRHDNEKVKHFKKTFSLLHKICTYPTIMNIVTILAVADIFLKKGAFKYLIIFYGVTMPILFMSKTFMTISKRRLG